MIANRTRSGAVNLVFFVVFRRGRKVESLWNLGSTVFNGKIFFTTKDTTLAPHCVGCSAGEVTKEKSP